MFVVNTGLLGIGLLLSFIMFQMGYIQLSHLPRFAVTPLSIVIQVVCVYNWTKDYNQKLEIKT